MNRTEAILRPDKQVAEERLCKQCKHYQFYDYGGMYLCENWGCEYEPREVKEVEDDS